MSVGGNTFRSSGEKPKESFAVRPRGGWCKRGRVNDQPSGIIADKCIDPIKGLNYLLKCIEVNIQRETRPRKIFTSVTPGVEKTFQINAFIAPSTIFTFFIFIARLRTFIEQIKNKGKVFYFFCFCSSLCKSPRCTRWENVIFMAQFSFHTLLMASNGKPIVNKGPDTPPYFCYTNTI